MSSSQDTAHGTAVRNYPRTSGSAWKGWIHARMSLATYIGEELFKDTCKFDFTKRWQVALREGGLVSALTGAAMGPLFLTSLPGTVVGKN